MPNKKTENRFKIADLVFFREQVFLLGIKAALYSRLCYAVSQGVIVQCKRGIGTEHGQGVHHDVQIVHRAALEIAQAELGGAVQAPR